MSVELIKDLLKIDQIIGKDSIQAMIAGEVDIPKDKPKAIKVLNIDGKTMVTDVKVLKDKIAVGGYITLNTLYKGEEGERIYSINSKTDFSENITIKGITDDMKADVKATIEHIDHGIVENGNIGVKTVLSMEGKVSDSNTINVLKDIQGERGIQVLKEKIKYNDMIGQNKSDTLIKDAFELEEDLPDIIEILKVDTKAYERETKVVDDKVIVAGVVESSIMYLGDDEDRKVIHITKDVPFTHFVDIPGISKELDHKVKVFSLEPEYEIKEDINGKSRIIDVEAVIDIQAQVFESKEKEVTVDAYSTDRKFDISKEKINVNESIGSTTVKETVKGTLNVSEDNEIIKEVYSVNTKPLITDSRIIDGKVIIEGIVDTNMLYLGEESGEIKSIRNDFPFKMYVDLDGIEEKMETDIELNLEGKTYQKINSREVEVETEIKTFVNVSRTKSIDVITEATELEEVIDIKNRPSIIIYTVKANDTLWDIAKRYNTNIEELIEVNNIMTPDNIMPGEKILIIKTIDVQI